MRKVILLIIGFISTLINVHATVNGWNWNVNLNGTTYSSSTSLGAFARNGLSLRGGWGNTWQNGGDDVCHIVLVYSVSGGGPLGNLIIDYVSSEMNGNKYHSKLDYNINISDLNPGSYTLTVDYQIYGRYGGTSCGTPGNTNEFTTLSLNTQTFNFSISTPAPINLNHFDVKSKGKTATLYWTTTLETNNDYFEILHSTTGKDFQMIGKVTGAGNSNTPHQYQFTHHHPGKGRLYYRLRQVDFDGKFEYSSVRYVAADHNSKDIKISPNPANETITFGYDGSKISKNISIRDITGRKILEYSNVTAESLDISQLIPGLYTLTIIADGVTTTQKLVKE